MDGAAGIELLTFDEGKPMLLLTPDWATPILYLGGAFSYILLLTPPPILDVPDGFIISLLEVDLDVAVGLM